VVRLECGNGLAFPFHAAFAHRHQAHQATQQRGLAHAVATQQAGDLAQPGFEGQAAQDVAAAVVLVQRIDLEHARLLK